MGWKHWLGLPLAIAACTADEPATSTTDQAMTAANGVWENGLTTNGLIMNGVWENGVWENGVWENGVWENGVWENGVWENGVWENGVWENGVWENGVWENGVWENGVWENGVENGVWENGVWENGVWENGVWENNLRAQAVIRENEYTQQVMQYLYSCAMPAGAHETLTIHDPFGVKPDLNIALDGGIGLWPTWAEDGTTCDGDCATKLTQWKNDMASEGTIVEPNTCDETCQRWISACLLARTNAYGVKVQISMRAPETAPLAIRNALALVSGEDAEFTKREGAYYGNLFATTPVLSSGALFANTPQYYACAGPISNVPQITKRFCSSQGDQAVIKVTGLCETQTGEPAMCTPPATAGFGERDCKTGRQVLATPTGTLVDEVYKEVITVYLRDPITKCGNAVCEEGEYGVCPSDCHEGAWASTYPYAFNYFPNSVWFDSAMTAVGPNNEVVFASSAHYQPIDMGGGPLDDSASREHGVLAKYSSSGVLEWSKRFGYDVVLNKGSNGVSVASDGSITVVSWSGFSLTGRIWVGRFLANGDPMPGWPITVGNDPEGGLSPQGAGAVDSQGNVFVTAYFSRPVTFDLPDGEHTFTPVPYPGRTFVLSDTLVIKLSPSGQVLWATQVGDYEMQEPNGLAVDKDNNVIASTWGNSDLGVYKLDGATGAQIWKQPGSHGGVVTDPATGDVYAAGTYEGSYTFYPYDYRSMFIAKYAAADGALLAVTDSPLRLCPNGASSCSGRFDGMHIAFTTDGNVVIAGHGGGNGGGVGRSTDIDFGAGRFTSYATQDTFLAAYKRSDLSFTWAKQVPFILSGTHRGFSIDSNNHIVMSGNFAGSMTIDNQMLVTSDPLNAGLIHTFITSFKAPPNVDDLPPVISDMPKNIVVQATEKQGTTKGAIVWYMPPAVIDAAAAGTNVVCDPPPNSFFPVGTTTVTCTAYDTHGNNTSATFTVTVKDTLGPIMFMPETDMAPVQANTTGGAVVTYALPTAKDQLDGNLTVTCDPPSGSLFAPGTTMVTCTAVDSAGNRTQREFPIYVEDHVDPELTVPTTTVTAEANATGGAIVHFEWSATDNTGVLTKACSQDSDTLFPVGDTLVTCTAVDLAGNPVYRSFTVTVADTVAPTLTVPTSFTVAGSGATTVTYSTSATDFTAVTTTCTPESGTTFAVGTTTVSCTATDSSNNSTTRTFAVTVTAPPPPPAPNVSWSGVLQPVNPDGSSVFKLGGVVPVKFTLTGADAGRTDLVATLTLVKLSSTPSGTEVEATATGSGDTGNTFRYDATGDMYIYNLSTKTLSVGDWELRINLGDGVVHTVRISLKK